MDMAWMLPAGERFGDAGPRERLPAEGMETLKLTRGLPADSATDAILCGPAVLPKFVAGLNHLTDRVVRLVVRQLPPELSIERAKTLCGLAWHATRGGERGGESEALRPATGALHCRSTDRAESSGWSGRASGDLERFPRPGVDPARSTARAGSGHVAAASASAEP